LGLPASLHSLKESAVTGFTEKGLPWSRFLLGATWMCPGWRGQFPSLVMAGPARTQCWDELWFSVLASGVY